MHSASTQAQRQTRAVVIERFGSADVLHTALVPLPPVGPTQVRLRVLAAAVNPVDIGTRAGGIIQGTVYPALAARFPMVLGWDAAGVIEEVGSEVRGWATGDQVVIMVHQVATQWGTYAEQMVVSAEQLAPYPGTVDPPVAAALPLAGLTALKAINALSLSAGEKVFINGPLGAVGRLAVQLARQRGARVVGMVRSTEREQAQALGIEWLIERDSDIATQIQAITGGPVDAAVDVVGGTVATATLDAVRDGGRYATVIPRLEPGPGTPVRCIIPQMIWITPNPAGLHDLSALLAKGILSIPIGATFALDQAAEAHRLAESRSVTGKIVLIP